MTRGMERILRRTLLVTAVFMTVAAVGLLIMAIATTKPSLELPSEQAFVTTGPNKSGSHELDPRYDRLSTTKLSKTVTARTEIVSKPPAPDLKTLVRLIGIMAYGDPKDNEAIIELIKTGQTKVYKTGDSITEVNATILQIDSAVTVKYDEKNIKLEVKSSSTAERSTGPLAQPGHVDGLAATDNSTARNTKD